MTQAYSIGRVTSDPELKTSARNVPYLRLSIAERIGYGDSAHMQYIQVWAWDGMTRQLMDAGVRKGSLIWVPSTARLTASTI